MVCFYCSKEIQIEDKKRMVPVEIPYINLWFHKDCYDVIKSTEVIYLSQNVQMILDYKERSKNKKQSIISTKE